MIRWWNAGRYERECAEFDARHPLSREVWEAIQEYRFERWLDTSLAPVVGFERDETEEWFRARYSAYVEYTCAGHNGVFSV